MQTENAHLDRMCQAKDTLLSEKDREIVSKEKDLLYKQELMESLSKERDDLGGEFKKINSRCERLQDDMKRLQVTVEIPKATTYN